MNVELQIAMDRKKTLAEFVKHAVENTETTPSETNAAYARGAIGAAHITSAITTDQYREFKGRIDRAMNRASI